MTGHKDNHGSVSSALALLLSLTFASIVWGGITKINSSNDPPPPIIPKPLFSGKLLQPLYPKSCPPYYKENYGYTRQRWQRWPGFVNPNPPTAPVPVPVTPDTSENPEAQSLKGLMEDIHAGKPRADSSAQIATVPEPIQTPLRDVPLAPTKMGPVDKVDSRPVVDPPTIDLSAAYPCFSWPKVQRASGEGEQTESATPHGK